jgi:hypothetical protein
MELQVLLGPQEPLAVKAAQVQLEFLVRTEPRVLLAQLVILVQQVLLGLLELELKVRLELLVLEPRERLV